MLLSRLRSTSLANHIVRGVTGYLPTVFEASSGCSQRAMFVAGIVLHLPKTSVISSASLNLFSCNIKSGNLLFENTNKLKIAHNSYGLS